MAYLCFFLPFEYGVLGAKKLARVETVLLWTVFLGVKIDSFWMCNGDVKEGDKVVTDRGVRTRM